MINIALAADEGYLDGLAGTLVGIAQRAPLSLFHTYILDCGITDASWREFERSLSSRWQNIQLWRIPINDAKLQKFAPLIRSRGLNNATYARFLLSDLLPEVDRIIYLDCDLVVDTDLNALFLTSLDGALAGAVAENHLSLLTQNIPRELIASTDRDLPAFNAGVLLLDLAMMRQANLFESIMDLIPQMQSRLQSQAVLNFIFLRRWKALPQRWNRQKFVTENFSIHRDFPDSVWHFIGKIKPWHFAPNHRRGLVGDFHLNLDKSGWSPQFPGSITLQDSTWRETLKSTRAFTLRKLRALVS